MANLMQLSFEFENVLQAIRDNEGEITPELSIQLREAETLVLQKIDNVGFHVVLQESKISGLKRIRDNVTRQIKSEQQELDGLKKWLAAPVRQYGTHNNPKGKNYASKVLAGEVVKIKDISKKVLIYDAEKVPDEYKNAILTITIPFDKLQEIFKDHKSELYKFLNKYSELQKIVVDESKINVNTEGVGEEWKYNVSFLGLSEIKKQTKEQK